MAQRQNRSICPWRRSARPRILIVDGEEPMSTLDAAVLDCVEICTDYRWLPSSDQTLRLIRLRDEVRSGARGEYVLTDQEQRRLRWLRWLVQRRLVRED
jgi:hypothetical protein